MFSACLSCCCCWRWRSQPAYSSVSSVPSEEFSSSAIALTAPASPPSSVLTLGDLLSEDIELPELPGLPELPNSNTATQNNKKILGKKMPKRKVLAASASSSSSSPRLPQARQALADEKFLKPENPPEPPARQALNNLTLPPGKLSRSSLDDLLSRLDFSSLDYRGVFAFLLSAPEREFPGFLLREFLEPQIQSFHNRKKEKLRENQKSSNVRNSGLLAADEADEELPGIIYEFFQFLAAHTMMIRSNRDRRTLTISFDFGGSSSKMLELHTERTFVLKSGNFSSPFLVCPENLPILADVDTRRLIFQRDVELQLSDNGAISDVRDGDIQVKKFLSFNAGLKFSHQPGLVDFDSENRAYLEVNKAGQPIIRENHYLPKTYDDWLIVTVLKQEVFIGLPKLARP